MTEVVGDESLPAVTSQLEESPREAPVTKSYANVVGKPTLSKFNIDVSVVDGKSTVVVPDAVLQDAVPLWEDFVVGRFPEPAPHIAKIHVIVNKIWNLGDKTIKIDAFAVNDRMIKFRIRNASARTRVLRRGMWNICDKSMMVSKWTPVAEDAQPEVRSMPMWVVLKNVPPSMFTWPGLSFLASQVGAPKRLHQETELVTCFDEAKIFVEVDLTQELPKSHNFQIKGEVTSVQYEYPWLPPRCKSCHRWGHFEDGCVTNAGRKSPSQLKTSEPVDIQTSPIILKVLTDFLTPPASNVENEVPVEAVCCEPTTAVAAASTNQAETSAPQNTVDIEEGELTLSPPAPVTTLEEEEWSKVTHSGGKRKNSRNRSATTLKFGEVRILSPTQFDALREPDDVEPDTDAPAIGVTQSDNPTATKSGTEDTATRPILPRNSKNGHRFLAGQSQKGTNLAPATINKRNSKPKR